MPFRCAEQGRIRRETVLRLGDADRQVAKAVGLPAGQLVTHGTRRLDMVGAVDAFGDGLDLVEEGHVVRIQSPEVCGLFRKRRRHDPGEGFGALAAIGPMRAERDGHANLRAIGFDHSDLGRRVLGEVIDRDHDGQPVLLQVFDMAAQIGETRLKGCNIFRTEAVLGEAAMQLQGLDRGDQHGSVWLETRLAAFDVEEFFRT